jgi:chromate transport protein ChrA
MSAPLPAPSAQPVSLFALYKLTFVVGLLSFGGGLSAWMRREVVLIRGWMTDGNSSTVIRWRRSCPA